MTEPIIIEGRPWDSCIDCDAFDLLSEEWVATGEGEMYQLQKALATVFDPDRITQDRRRLRITIEVLDES